MVETLKKYWGYSSYRPLQEEIIQSVLDGKDTLALMPTGGGKSICFQVPAMMREGICIVVSPLIALMKDQVENLQARDIPAVAVFSGMGKREVATALENCVHGPIKFLYLSPERLTSEHVQEMIRHMNVNLFAIDEAHCISQWGYDFRPPYLNLKMLRELHPEVPFLALTATATAQVVDDIQEKLGFLKPRVLKMSFYRENLAYMVLNEEDKHGRMVRIIRKLGGSGIVYVRNRRKTQDTVMNLRREGISSDFYHAGLTSDERNQRQEAWKKNQTKVIVATNAFGMGIDKPDVRFVIHLEPPDSLEAYYQEAGRGGRDGKKAYAILLFQESDLIQLRKNLAISFPDNDYVSRIYHALGNYYQLAYGAGENLNFDFDLGDFCKKFKFEVLPALSALKLLERNGWITLSENVFLPSRLKFEVGQSDLYKFQVENQSYDPFIKLVLRSYGGIFDHFVAVRENDLAQATGQARSKVIQALEYLHQQEILTYIPQTDSPQLQFCRPRVDRSRLHLDWPGIRVLRETREEQLQSVFTYLEQQKCRSQLLLSYFSENSSLPCGSCDICLKTKNSRKSAEKIREEIIVALSESPLCIKELVDRVPSADEKYTLTIVRELLEEGILTVKNDLYLLR